VPPRAKDAKPLLSLLDVVAKAETDAGIDIDPFERVDEPPPP
jgi:hypothetical protein